MASSSTSKLSAVLFILALSLLFSCSTAARPLPVAPPAQPPAPPATSTLLDRATSIANSLSKAFKLVFDNEPAAAISNSPHRLDEYIRIHLASVVRDAVGVLKSKDRSIIASLLDSHLMSLVTSQERVLWTVFAPADEDIRQGDFELMSHLVPGRDVALIDLKLMANGTRFQKNMDGVPLQLTKNQDQLMVNGVEITAPDLFRGPWIVVHGIKGVFPKQSMEEQQVRHHETDGFFTHAAHQDS